MRQAAMKRRTVFAVTIAAATIGLTGCGGSSQPGPQEVAKTYVSALEDHNFQKACDQVESSQRNQCTAAFEQISSFSTKDMKVGKAVTEGDRALVSVTGKICAEVTASKQCSGATDPAAGMPDSSTSFDKAFATATSGSSDALAASPMIRSKGKWYVQLT